ncbi:patatin-like phospholipase family protein [Noviherbaspirillum cavernae]|uniref:Patatin-like phospholipase family protein n=1 Tax=Noviherbaspirillum cavernae TaxID=2320862 RepID=A0A418WXK2_9BURK|nr:patatin-like phospholipase family protein [Noviherbaspirillum cavernae]RJG04978.1 patatin-like phospholipase family protein [Noviherbaspirillum cavernae]
MNALAIHAGPKALAHLREHGLRAQDIAIIPAAAGGPKGLIFQKLDQWLFGRWLPSAQRERTLIGASIGAWRMAAACHADPVAAFQRLGDLYSEQRYPPRTSPRMVTEFCKQLLGDFMGGHESEVTQHPHHRLHILASRGSRLLKAPRLKISEMAGFSAAVLGNLISRSQLAHHLERVVLGDARDPAFWLKARFDAFDTHFAPLLPDNIAAALLASGTLPFIMEPVRHIAHAPVGTYWDGGLIDYHLALPYSRVAGNPEGGLVLYPHFGERIVPGWFDKQFPWRRAGTGSSRNWLDNVILISPSRAFLQTLSRGKLPDRKDFLSYGANDDFRILNWKLAISEGARLRDELAAFVEKPDLRLVKSI